MAAAAAVYLAAVLEYLTPEILDLASDVAHESKKIRINPRPIMLSNTKRRGAQQAVRQCYHRAGRRPALHPARAAA